MRTWWAVVVCLGLLTGCVPAPGEGRGDLAPTGIVVGHEDVALFEEIPAEWLAAAEGMTLLFTDQSVGFNVSAGLDCLAVPSASAPSHCKRWQHVVPEFSTSLADVYWPGVYPRTAWRYQDGSYVADAVAAQQAQPAEVFGYFPSYLSGPALLRAPGVAANLEPLFAEAARSDATLVLFTSSLARGTENGAVTERALAQVNDDIRALASARGAPLLDVADILSHTPDSQHCYDNRDGVPYVTTTRTENHPDDSIDTPAICPQYTTEAYGGHLGSVSAGKIRVAKAMWVLMAQIAGWQPGGTPEPTPTATDTETPEPTATLEPTVTPTETPEPTATPEPFCLVEALSQMGWSNDLASRVVTFRVQVAPAREGVPVVGEAHTFGALDWEPLSLIPVTAITGPNGMAALEIREPDPSVESFGWLIYNLDWCDDAAVRASIGAP